MTSQDGIVELLGEKIREISISEFFEKNRHLLGYENPTKSLLTVVKELVDNSIDACIEAGILPEVKVLVKNVKENIFRVKVEDNGPGLPPEKIPIAFGKFLVGSKFYRLRQSIGTQGIGAKGAILYSQLTTAKPTKIYTFYRGKKYEFDLMIDVLKNEPQIVSENILDSVGNRSGLGVELFVEGRYIEKGQSIPTYLKYISVANPYVKIIYDGPNEKCVFNRAVNSLPKKPIEIKPHPYGVEIGRLKRMLSLTETKSLSKFLTTEFSRIGVDTANKICKLAKLKPSQSPRELNNDEIERLWKSMQMVKIRAPPTDCLSPLNKEELIKGMQKEFPNAEFYDAILRPPKVYRGNPFQVEVAIAYGGEIANIVNESCLLLRFANHTPLLYNQSDCAITRAVEEVDWRNYKLSQPQKGLPQAPLIILVDLISVWIPYKSEGKQAIAEYPEIIKEIKLGLQEVGRKLGLYLSKKFRLQALRARKNIFDAYSTIFSEYLSNLTEKSKEDILNKIRNLISKGIYKDIDEKEEKKEVTHEIEI